MCWLFGSEDALSRTSGYGRFLAIYAVPFHHHGVKGESNTGSGTAFRCHLDGEPVFCSWVHHRNWCGQCWRKTWNKAPLQCAI